MKPSNPTLAELLAYQACLQDHSVRFTTAIDAVVNTLLTFQAAGRLKAELNKYLKPRVLALDELGYLPSIKLGPICYFRSLASAMNAAQ